MIRIPFVIFFVLQAFAVGFAQTREHTLFLIGDCGEPLIKDSPLGKVFSSHVANAGEHTTVIYLGDNIYPSGMPPTGTPGRDRAERILQTQVNWTEASSANTIFIPGNHDWQHWGPKGLDYIHNEQGWLDSLKDDHVKLLPRDGCPGPVEIPLTDNSVLIIIDTQWLLHEYDRPGDESDCSAKDPSTLMTLLEDALIRNRHKRIIVAGHHPVITYGEHGGVFSLQDHLFPLVDWRPQLYIPLPVLGSLYPLYRGVFGHPQDVKHPTYHEFSKLIQKMLAQYKGSIYVAGHEHALEHIMKDSTHYIVSGSGSKTTFVKKKRFARFVAAKNGFVKLHILTGGAVSVEFWQVDDEFPDGKIVHEADISMPDTRDRSDSAQVDFRGKVVRVSASEQYDAGPVHDFLLGENYRGTWSTEIEVPVFDLGSEKGGLRILQKGGGQQTLSLRLEARDGKEYTLRSIEKYPEKAVPEMFRGTFAQDLVQDQISASHPYAALVVPMLADAAGIYHTNPRVVYIPDDPRLGLYRKDFANTLALFEERPAGDWKESLFFGNSTNIVNTSKVLEKVQKDNKNQVDQDFVVRSRLFDLWIGDWDRHDDQWRWASFKEDKAELYRPIPRDRDQAFFLNDGVVPKIWSRKWALPKFEGFDNEINWASGLSFNARYFDRSFLNELEEKNWVDAAKELEGKLTDEVIEQAIRTWPEEIYKRDGEKVIRALKARRKALVHHARDHYAFLAREVDVPASDKDELFEVSRFPDGDVNVQIFNINKEGGKGRKFYERTFRFGETNEIRLYGRGGNDEFEVEGDARRSILVRIIGGDGSDSLRDKSHVRGLRKKTMFYDDRSKNDIMSKGEVRDLTSTDPAVNTYDRKAFKYNRLAPLLYGNFNPDDGLFFGGGFLFQKEGFRKTPFHQRHIALASIAPRTNSYNLLYRGDFNDVFGDWGIGVRADLKSPNYVNNFFGMGNESKFEADINDDPGIDVDDAIDYYRFRFEELRTELFLKRTLGKGSSFSLGPAYQRIEIEEPNEDRFINEYAETLSYDLYNEYNSYAGAAMEFQFDKRNDPRFTSRGLAIEVSSRTMRGLDKRANDYSSANASLSIYHSFRIPARTVFAARIGGGRNLGDYNFYQAQILSGRTEVRGFRKTRFYGDSKFYGNFEIRLKLSSIRTYLFPASVGILGFFDTGRVWYKDKTGKDPSAGDGTSNRWHNGWGGGIWFTPFNLTVLSIEAGHSNEGTLGYVRLGFLF
jgi:hypothetical protein